MSAYSYLTFLPFHVTQPMLSVSTVSIRFRNVLAVRQSNTSLILTDFVLLHLNHCTVNWMENGEVSAVVLVIVTASETFTPMSIARLDALKVCGAENV